MTFARPWMLLFAAAPGLWLAYGMFTASRRLAFALKALSLGLILAALAEPVVNIPETRVATPILVDTSASISAEDLARASSITSAILKAKGRNWARVLPFARSTRDLMPGEETALRNTNGEAGRDTDLESSIREAVASLPTGLVPRLVLISDGKENAGSVTRAAWQARKLGIPIDTFSLDGRPRPNLRLESVSVPGIAFAGESFPVELAIVAPQDQTGVVEMMADGKVIGANPVTLTAGLNRIRAHASLATTGAVNLTGVIRTGTSEIRFDQALTLRRPRLLYLSQDPPGTEANLLQALNAAQFDVVASRDPMQPPLDGFQIAALNNIDMESLPPARKTEIEEFVKQGGGLAVIGGERNLYKEKKIEDALDRTLPAKLAPPRSPEGTCVILIIDKSSSMEGKKIELARLAAIGVIDNLRPIDKVGVLIFDNSFQWAVPIRRAEDRSLIKRLVAGITPDGGTQIAPALSEAYHKILPVKATFKHVVLLTDGISEEGDSVEVSRDALGQHVTISTVGLGQDVNRAYLEKVASSAGGRSYFLNDPAGLEQILLRDVLEHTGSTAVEKTLRPVVTKNVEILAGVGMESAPLLKGYVKFVAKPSAETILTIDEKDPLLARWQYGLGRAVVFASDAKSRWAEQWVAWKGFDRFWTNLFRDLLPHAQAGEASAIYDPASGDLVVEYHLGRNIGEPLRAPAVFVFGPGGFQRPLEITKVAEKTFRGRLPVGQRQGLFRIRPLVESRAFPEAGFYKEEQEVHDYGSNPILLREISEFTGGRFNPDPRRVFDPAGRAITAPLRLWPGLLGLAIALSLLELLLRKGKGVLGRWWPA